MIKNEYNIIITPISLLEGMAGTQRVRNFAEILVKDKTYKISNLIISKNGNNHEKKIIDGIDYYQDRYSSVFSNLRIIINIMIFLIHKKDKKKNNLIFYYDIPHLPFLLILCFISKVIGYKIIVDVVENYNTYTSHHSFRVKLRIRFVRIVYNHLSMFSDGLIAISFPLYNNLYKKYGKKLPIVHIPVNCNPLKIKCNNLKVNPTCTTIFYGGSFGEKDGLLLLLDAFDNLTHNYSNLRLILTGVGNNKDMELFFSKLNKCINKQHINYLGYLSEEQYYDTLSVSDIFCVTRINSVYANSGFPFKLAEFLSTGKPVVATKVGDIPYYLNDDSCILVEPDSSEAIKNGIEMLLLNKELSKKIGENGKKVAEANFISQNLISKLKELISNV